MVFERALKIAVALSGAMLVSGCGWFGLSGGSDVDSLVQEQTASSPATTEIQPEPQSKPAAAPENPVVAELIAQGFEVRSRAAPSKDFKEMVILRKGEIAAQCFIGHAEKPDNCEKGPLQQPTGEDIAIQQAVVEYIRSNDCVFSATEEGRAASKVFFEAKGLSTGQVENAARRLFVNGALVTTDGVLYALVEGC